MKSPPLKYSKERSSPATRGLRGLVALSWTGWAWAIGSLYLQQRYGVHHAMTWLWLPQAILGVFGGITLLVMVLCKMRRGQSRGRILAWGAIGLLPLVLWGVFAVTLRIGSARRIAHKVGHLAASSLVPLVAQLLYPHQLESERLIMFYHDNIDDPANDLATMEAHLASLEQILGRRQHSKIVWVRGPALLRESASINCIALGENGRPRATHADRHEVAHALLFQFTRPDADPPRLLIEGWARAVEGHPKPLASTALDNYDERLPLECFLLPKEYHRVGPWSYYHGGALVDHLLRLRGPDRFLDWYNLSRPESCLDDFQRVYGMRFREMERAFWRELKVGNRMHD